MLIHVTADMNPCHSWRQNWARYRRLFARKQAAEDTIFSFNRLRFLCDAGMPFDQGSTSNPREDISWRLQAFTSPDGHIDGTRMSRGPYVQCLIVGADLSQGIV